MLPASARLLRLLSLLQDRRHWPGSVLAERLGITGRTVRRDVERLRRLGYRIRATPGVTGGYRLVAGGTLPPLVFADDEALAVTLALRNAALGGVQGIERSALEALLKLQQLLPPRLARQLEALQRSIRPMTGGVQPVDAALLTTIALACESREVLRMDYRDALGRLSERRIEPLGLVSTGGRWYVVAWDRDREDWRTFRVDRIRAVRNTGETFPPRQGPEDGDLAAFVSRNVSTEVYTVRARVLLHAPREKMAERIPPTVGKLVAVDATRCRLHTGAHHLPWLAAWLCTLGTDFEVESPQPLRTYLQEVHARLSRSLAGTAQCPG